MSRNSISLSVPPIRLELPAAATSAVQNGRLASLIFRNRERMVPHPFLLIFFLTSHMAASTITAIPAVTSPWTFKG